MIYRSESVKHIINKVFRDFGMTISQHTDALSDMIEWAGEALEAIGATSPLEDKPAKIVIKNNRGSLPCDLYLIKQVCWQGRPLKYGAQTFNYSQHCDDCVNERASCEYSYTVNPNYINSDLPDGESIEIFYQAFPTDEQGFPLIPSDVTFKQAIMWYIISRLMLRGFEHPDKKLDFEAAEARWLKYCTQAENDAKMLDIARYESFKDQWVRLIPNVNPGNTFHANSNVEERLYRGERRDYEL